MAVKLNVRFVTQLGIGGHVVGAIPRDDPTGCWYASASMVGYYFEEGPRLGVPELFKRTLGDGRLGHHATGSGPAKHLSADHHDLLAQREDLEPVAHCAQDHIYTLDELEELLRKFAIARGEKSGDVKIKGLEQGFFSKFRDAFGR